MGVVVVHFGRDDYGRAALDSIERSGLAARVVFVDNNPAPSPSLRGDVRRSGGLYLSYRENLGYAAGANAGVAHLTSRPLSMLAVMNSDVCLGRNALLRLESVVSDPRVGVAGPALLRAESPRVCWNVGSFVRWPSGRPGSLAHGDRYCGRAAGVRAGARDVDFVCGACVCFRPGVLQRLGGFDPKLVLYFEDADLSYRARREGLRTVVVPAARAWHIGGAATGTGAVASYYRTRNRLVFSRRWNPYRWRGALARGSFALRTMLGAVVAAATGRRARGAALLRAVLDGARSPRRARVEIDIASLDRKDRANRPRTEC